jgi:hypothetical protein
MPSHWFIWIISDNDENRSGVICVAVELTFTAEFRSYNATENITKIKRSYKMYALHNNYGKFALLLFLDLHFINANFCFSLLNDVKLILWSKTSINAFLMIFNFLQNTNIRAGVMWIINKQEALEIFLCSEDHYIYNNFGTFTHFCLIISVTKIFTDQSVLGIKSVFHFSLQLPFQRFFAILNI